MVTKLEKQFFKTFKIEPKYTYLVTDMFYTSDSHNYEATKNDLIEYFSGKNCGRYKVMKVYKTYPRITDHILLKLICIANSQNIGFEGDNIEDIKKDLLDNFIFFKRDVYDQIHNLFKEVE